MRNFNTTFTVVCLLFLSLSFTANAQEDKKLEKAEANFCESLTSFAKSLETVDAIDDNASMDEFNAAYKAANKAWNKLQKKATKLENVELKESVKAYNKMVDAINGMDSSVTTKEANAQINGHIDSTAEQIADIQSITCM